MSDEEFEQFEISDFDYQSAMNPGTKRHRMSKEQSTYGIWSAKEYEDSDDDVEDEGFRNKRKNKSATGGILFVSGGIKGAKKKQQEDDGDDDNADSNDLKDGKHDNNDSDSSIEEIKIEKKTSHNRNQYTKGKNNEVFRDKDFGEWERHTTGFGSKMLKKMGYEAGKGLGSKGQGLVKPIEAKLRKGKGAIGMYGKEAPDRPQKIQEEDFNENEPNETQKTKHVPQWRKQGQKKKPKYIIKTADEVLIEDLENGGDRSKNQGYSVKHSVVSGVSTSKIKIIDMTGKEQKILQGYESLSKRHNKPDDQDGQPTGKNDKRLFDLPELMHNLDVLVNLTEDKIFQSDRQMKYHEDMVISMWHEEKRINEITANEENQINSLNQLLSAIENCEKALEEGNKSMDDYIDMFKELKKNYYNEYKLYNLNDLCLPLLEPLFHSYYANWNPFKNTKTKKLGFSIFTEWKQLLEDTNSASGSGYLSKRDHQMDSYHRLIWQHFMPPVRRAIISFSIRNSGSIIDFVDTWSPLLPQWIYDNMLHQLILPKLNKEVDEWNPLTDTMPIHHWMHPWLPYLKDHLEPLHAQIRQKIANALINWHPSDKSAKALIQPWQTVFPKVNWDTFMNNNILPKLKICLNNEFTINPRQQNLEPWKWVMEWEDLIPTEHFIGLLEIVFFPKWLQVLSVWLNAGPNYDEVSRWYVGWKNLFSDKLLNNPSVKQKITQALVMMNKSVGGTSVSYIPSPTTGPALVQPTYATLGQPVESTPGIQTTSNPTIKSFKDMVEKKAAEHNIIFLPVPNRMHEGKQIYRLGNLNIYLDRNVVFCLKNGIWSPASLNQVIQQAL